MDPWTDRLSEYIDDELAGTERQALEAHLAGCADCRAVLADLRALIRRAAALPDRMPVTDLWPGIDHRIRQVRPARRVISVSLSQLVAAALVLMALSGGLVWVLRGPAGVTTPDTGTQATHVDRAPGTALPVSFADETYDRAVTDLQRALEDGRRERLDPATVKVIERNLAAIDAAILQAKQALESDPSNTYLNGHLVEARRRKLALLRRVNAMADPEG